MAALGLSFLLPETASASCYIDGASGRLSNYCALDKIQGARVDARTAQLIDYKLKLEGSTRGLGFPARFKPNSTSNSLYPILSYSDNINGGNSPEPLVIGSLTFGRWMKLSIAKEGRRRLDLVLALVGVIFTQRENTLPTVLMPATPHSPKYGLGIATTSANVSSINHIKNWWFLDANINTSRVRKDITDETNSNISLISSKVYASSENTYSEASIGVNRYFAESYNQNQLLLGYKNYSRKRCLQCA